MTEMDESPGELIKPAARREAWKEGEWKGGESRQQATSSLSGPELALEDSLGQDNCCPLHHQRTAIAE